MTAVSVPAPQAALPYRYTLVRAARLDWGLAAPVADFAAQIHQESGWQKDAVSIAGAEGLAQFMPATTDWIGLFLPELSAKAPFNPGWAIRALTYYDKWLWQRIVIPDNCERMAMVLSAYNGGLTWVKRDRRLAASRQLLPDIWFSQVETVNAGRRLSAWRENRHYPKHILFVLAPRYLSWGEASCV